MHGKDKEDPLEPGWRAGLSVGLMPDPGTAPDGGSVTLVVKGVVAAAGAAH
jgi:hypothetical protein